MKNNKRQQIAHVINPSNVLSIASVGLAHGSKSIELTASLLQEVANSYDPTVYAAPLVKGHPKNNDPRLGTVQSLDFSQPDLLARSAKVDADFAEQVNAGAFPYLSMSIYEPTAAANPVPGQYYLRHVGFLGAVAPAVKNQQPASFNFSELDFSGDEDGVITFAFNQTDERDLGQLFSNLREFIVDKHDIETADKVLPTYILDGLLSNTAQSAPIFQEPTTFQQRTPIDNPKSQPQEQMSVDKEQAAALSAENETLKRQLATQQDQQSKAQHQNHISFAEALVSAGQLKPSNKALTVAVLDALADSAAGIADFGEGDEKAPLLERFKGQLTQQAATDFSEQIDNHKVGDIKGECPLLADAKARSAA